MRLNINVQRGLLFLTLALGLFLGACKKDKPTPPKPIDPPVNPPSGSTRMQLTLDSLYLYAKQVYFWNDALPSAESFNARQYSTKSTDLANYNDALFAFTQIKINPQTGKPYEFVASANNPNASAGYPKYSYISDKTTQNPSGFVPEKSAAVDLEGNGNDVGVKLGAYGTSTTDPNAFALYIQAVYQNSPADKAGLTRGARITKVNGTTIGSNYSAQVNMINTAFAASSVTIEGTDVNGAAYNKTLAKAVYKSSPVYKAKVLTSGSKKVGYLAFARFSNKTNAQPDLDAAFTQFAGAGVTDLVIDLRYNGGGYISTAVHILNNIAPSSFNGRTMFVEYYNQMMQSGQATILTNQPLLDANGKPVKLSNGQNATYANVDYSSAGNTEVFQKLGPLTGVTNVVFITTGSTASASELLINSLKPHMTVKVVGKTTYGKPIGFFPIVLENRYEVLMSMFETKNSAGSGEYYAGFKPDVEDVAGDNLIDDATRDFGDPQESYLAAALNVISPSSVFTGNARTLGESLMTIGNKKVSVKSIDRVRTIRDGNEFNGMIADPKRLKLKTR